MMGAAHSNRGDGELRGSSGGVISSSAVRPVTNGRVVGWL